MKVDRDEVIIDTHDAASSRVDQSRLMNQTKRFMDQFSTRTLHNLKHFHWKVINDHKTELSYKRLPNNEILLLTRARDMHRIFSAIFKPNDSRRPHSPMSKYVSVYHLNRFDFAFLFRSPQPFPDYPPPVP